MGRFAEHAFPRQLRRRKRKARHQLGVGHVDFQLPRIKPVPVLEHRQAFDQFAQGQDTDFAVDFALAVDPGRSVRVRVRDQEHIVKINAVHPVFQLPIVGVHHIIQIRRNRVTAPSAEIPRIVDPPFRFEILHGFVRHENQARIGILARKGFAASVPHIDFDEIMPHRLVVFAIIEVAGLRQ